MPRPQRRATARTAGVLLAVGALLVAAPSVAGARSSADPCDELLVTARPDGSTGRTDAVLITSQTVEQGIDGWAALAWQPTPGTQLRTIEVVTTTAVHTLPGDATTTDVGGIVEVRFCGTSGDTLAADEDVTVAGTPGDDTRAGTQDASEDPAGGWTRLVLAGAGIGAAIGGVVLLLGRGARGDEKANA